MPGICSQEGRCTELSQNVPGKRAKAREGQAGIWLIKVPRRRAGAWAIQQRLGQTPRSLEHLPSTCRKRRARQEAAECFMSRGAVLGSVGEGEPVGGRELVRAQQGPGERCRKVTRQAWARQEGPGGGQRGDDG